MTLDKPVWVRESDAEDRSSSPRQGIQLNDLPFFDEERGVMFRVVVGVTGPEAYSPRHHHTFDQVRYFIDGRTEFGKEVVGPGDCMYFPEGAYYGPQKSHAGEACKHIAIQFSGPSGIPYPSPVQQARAVEELKAEGGSFEKGIYKSAAGKNIDGFEAMLAHLTGLPVEYPEPRVTAPVLMRSANYEWTPLDDHKGVATKDLGFFNDRGPGLKLIRLEPGSRLVTRPSPYQELWLVVEGSIRYGDHEYGTVSCGYLPPEIDREDVSCTQDEQAVVLVMQVKPRRTKGSN